VRPAELIEFTAGRRQ